MNFIRIIFLASIFFIFVYHLEAQYYGIKGGLNLSNDGWLHNDVEYKYYDYKPGFHFGVFYDFSLKGSKILETGLYLDSKGHKTYFERAKTLYLDVPIKLYFSLISDDKASLYFFTGLYFGIGIWGKETYRSDSLDPIKYSWGYETKEDVLKPFDFGLGVGLSLRKGKLKYSISADQGLINIKTSGRDLYNHIVKFSIAYTLKVIEYP